MYTPDFNNHLTVITHFLFLSLLTDPLIDRLPLHSWLLLTSPTSLVRLGIIDPHLLDKKEFLATMSKLIRYTINGIKSTYIFTPTNTDHPLQLFSSLLISNAFSNLMSHQSLTYSKNNSYTQIITYQVILFLPNLQTSPLYNTLHITHQFQQPYIP